MKTLYLARHGVREDDEDGTVWERSARLTEAGVVALQNSAQKHLAGRPRIVVAYVPDLDRNIGTAIALTGSPSLFEIANALDPCAIWLDAEWRKVFRGIKDYRDAIRKHRCFFDPVGRLGANFLREKIRTLPDGQALLAVLNSPVMESIVDRLFAQDGRPSPVRLFGRGDLLRVRFSNDRIRYWKHLPI